MGRVEVPLDAELVRGLLSRQFPEWAQLPLEFVARGTVNAMFRLGDNMVVRLPFIAGGGEGIDLEAAWLPRLAGRLNAPIPELLGVGEPDEAYPSSWLVVSWLPGDPAVPGSTQNPDALARDLAGFLLSLRDVDTTDAPPGYRTGPLVELDASVRECAEQVHDLVDVASLVSIWDEALAARAWGGPPMWAHCDMLPGNVLVSDVGESRGRLSGVLDFEVAGIGDPACDLMAAWSILPSSARDGFRDALGTDDDSWNRGRGWALAQAVIALPYYRSTNRHMATTSLHILRELVRGR